MKILRIADVGHQHAVEEAARVLQAGGIVLYPTDTLYGFGVDIRNSEAVERLLLLKGRERKKPISVIVPSVAVMHEHAVLHERAEALAQTHLPGALTLVLAAREHIPESITLNGALGLRIPDDTVVLALAKAFNAPFTATSANLSGHPTAHVVMDIIINMGPSADLIDLVLDDGPRSGGVPSTVVLYTGETPLVLRDGALSRADLGIG